MVVTLGAAVAQPAPSALPQAATPSRQVLQLSARATSSTTLLAGKSVISLWGIEPVAAAPASVALRARIALDNLIRGQKIECELKKRADGSIQAQCVNAQDQDLSLYMLQQGYVTADRASVYGTVFEDPYLQAETHSQEKEIGVWSAAENAGHDSGTSGILMIVLGSILFLCIIGVFAYLSLTIMRGFQKVIDAQNDNMEMMTKERKLREQERTVVAVMLDSELKANKAKIEAYLAVYEEMLRSMSNSDRTPKYKKAGDIVQKQPALARGVFDRNTDKLDVLGGRLSSELVHFYARIKSKPEYENLEPEMQLEEALAIVQKAVDNAKRMDKLVSKILDIFTASNFSHSYEAEENTGPQLEDEDLK